MTEIEDRNSKCGNKIKYYKRKDARTQRNHYQLKFSGHRMEIYKCPYCEFFHIGHKIGNRPKDKLIKLTLQG